MAADVVTGVAVDVAVVATAVVYVFASLLLAAFGVNLLALSLRVSRRGRRTGRARRTTAPAPARPAPGDPIADIDLPRVTVQLPIYDELYVSERIIAAACALDYPRDRLQIQVLDDSDDETTLVVADAVAAARARGVDIVHRQRPARTGYKAGALAEGLTDATGEYVAIFDADFVPPPDFLRRTLPHFDAPNVAFVQARWGHLNRDHSWLTRLQALAIDGHFLVEQAGRGAAGYWFNFNGTAGVWRVAAIEDAGGWTADTLTEDLDLSYRAHLRGWRGRYLDDLVVPGEVPVQLPGFRRQQHRWARGSLECAARLLPAVWRSGAPLATRAQASLHLCAYSIHLLLLTLLAIYPAVVLADVATPGFTTMFGAAYVLGLTSLAPTMFLVTGSRRAGRRWFRDLPAIAAVTVFGAGLMVNTARAAIQIFTRPNPTFERTAKFGLARDPRELVAADRSGGVGVADGDRGADRTSGPARPSTSCAPSGPPGGPSSWKLRRYQLHIDRIVVVELAVAAYAFGSAVLAGRHHNWGVCVFASIFAAGLALVSGATLAHAWSMRRIRRRRVAAIDRERHTLALARRPVPRHTWPMATDPAPRDAAGQPRRAVIVMAKRPSPGTTKTRLEPALSSEQAAALYERFLIDTLAAVGARDDATLVIAVDRPESAGYFHTLAADVPQVPQIGADLGERLDSVLTRCLDQGFEEVYALGSDSPDLPAGHLDAAFASLADPEVDVVLGPTDDGGYYLIGCKRRWRALVTEVTMSTPTVLADTLAVADRVGARVALAPAWYDVDHPDDLDRLRASLAGGALGETADFLATL